MTAPSIHDGWTPQPHEQEQEPMTDYTDCPLCGEGVDMDNLPDFIAQYERSTRAPISVSEVSAATLEKMCEAFNWSLLSKDNKNNIRSDMRAALAVFVGGGK